MIERKVTHHSAASATAAGAVMNCTGLVGALVQITGTFVATVTFQGTIDASNWVAIRAENPNSGAVASTATAAGMYYVPFAGVRLFRAYVTWTSGTSITVTGIGVGSPPSHPFATDDPGFGLANVLEPGSVKGKVIYVDTAANGGADTNDGLSSGTPKLTISGALDACTAYMWDTIVVLNHTAASEIAWPIAVDVAGVHITGACGGGYMPRYTGSQIINAASVGNTACIHMDANHIRISHLGFRAGASHGCIEFDTANVSRHGIYSCTFESGTYGVYATADSKPSQGPTIKDCLFISSISSHGINYLSNGPFARFEHNIFDEVGGVAINGSPSAANACFVLNNTMSFRDNTAAKGIVLSGQAQRWIIDGNHANFGAADMTNNPYKDTSAQDNHWLVNYRALTAVLPATS